MHSREAPHTPGDPAGIPRLTPREGEVLRLLGAAVQNREIGKRLGIAERTVKAHLGNLMSKIAVTTRIEAAIFAYAHYGALTERATHGDDKPSAPRTRRSNPAHTDVVPPL
ncbi:helix-turn-helix transcriptional regulator [Streptomyces sp. NBC_00237]|uniref:helix-turn-helix domain-containing protein n=1 Tax=Streptomyces sp. NBC_00237 TaxID=2975687 RepID=UPI00225127E3|nr:helix-turn-helix transcriptional regulator [Streptomyces sp. NBC_00237]MCX5204699.1 helix-turn-helix transcriptional regulator [Streptomyces sp. NBC_00237]